MICVTGSHVRGTTWNSGYWPTDYAIMQLLLTFMWRDKRWRHFYTPLPLYDGGPWTTGAA